MAKILMPRRYHSFYAILTIVAALLSSGCTKSFLLPDSSHQQVRSASRAFAMAVAPELKAQIKPWRTLNLVVGDFTNANTAESTVSGQELQKMLLLDLRQELPGINVMQLSQQAPLDDSITIHGNTRYVPGNATVDSPSWFRVQLMFSDISKEKKIGAGALLINARQFDPMPSRFYRDAPMYLTGKRHQERLNSVTGKGRNIRSIVLSDAVTADAIADYEKMDFAAAEKKFNVISQADSNNLTALSGYYQSLFKMGKMASAEQAFGNLLKQTIAENNLSVKFLFRVRSREFWDDSELGSQYTMWVRQIARQVFSSGNCLEINGHASKSGSAEFNDSLSLSRAQWVKEQIIKIEPKLAGRIHANGKGFRETIIGSGTDDALDAIDRRVEFILCSCKKK